VNTTARGACAAWAATTASIPLGRARPRVGLVANLGRGWIGSFEFIQIGEQDMTTLVTVQAVLECSVQVGREASWSSSPAGPFDGRRIESHGDPLRRHGSHRRRRDVPISHEYRLIGGLDQSRPCGRDRASVTSTSRSPSGPTNSYRWLNPPDSSGVMATDTGCRSKWAMASSMSASSNPARSRLTPWRTRIRWIEIPVSSPVSG